MHVRKVTAPRLTCLWPGLGRLWWLGQWQGLASAFIFTLLLNALAISTFLWFELVPPAARVIACAALSLWWVIAAIATWRALPNLMAPQAEKNFQGLFVAAQGEYLRGNWFQAEAHLRKLLRWEPHDVESLLLLATLLRHTNRGDLARGQLQRLERLEGANRWRLEIQRERELLRTNSQREHATETHKSRFDDRSTAADSSVTRAA